MILSSPFDVRKYEPAEYITMSYIIIQEHILNYNSNYSCKLNWN